ncbi:MAG: hypothetical protein K8823_974 [Cenarchaeum symbiont of Oopsacas minuta]|nr:hypothetical protein [Cenarchaeum symbiont of Oopsacas minuta]
MLFGVFAIHSPESCPLNNDTSAEKILYMYDKMGSHLAEFNIHKVIGSYVSALEHQWILILDAKSAHDIEEFCIKVGISSINTVKIVPLNTFEDIVERIKSGNH